MSVLFVTHCQPGPLLGGGPRRTYQLFHELREYFGPDQVALISSGDLFPNAAQPRMTFRRYLTWVIARSRGTIANPFKLFLQNQRAPMHLSGAGLRRYHQAVKVKRPTVCILEGPGLGSVAEINASFGVRTIIAPWSFDSLTGDISALSHAFQEMKSQDSICHRLVVRSVFTDLANEMMVYSKSVRNWFLSQIEAGFAKAAGLSAAYFPYYPVGEAMEALIRVRRRRNETTINRRLFLISGGNAQNSIALEDFLMRLGKVELPSRLEIAIVGTPRKPRNLIPELEHRVRFCGYLSLEEFDTLLTQCSAVLVPQKLGFGCLTRVPDMLCAGIPVIADQIAANATGKLPGVHYVEDSACGWGSALDRVMCAATSFSSEDFEKWRTSMRSLALNEFELNSGCA